MIRRSSRTLRLHVWWIWLCPVLMRHASQRILIFQYVTNKEKAKQYRNYSLAYFGHMCEQLMSVLISLSSPQECSPWPTLDRTPTAPSSSCAPPRPSGSMASTSSSARFVEIIMTSLVMVNFDGNDKHRQDPVVSRRWLGWCFWWCWDWECWEYSRCSKTSISKAKVGIAWSQWWSSHRVMI